MPGHAPSLARVTPLSRMPTGHHSGPRRHPRRRDARLHRRRRPAVGRAAPPLGRARQPRPRRGAARVAACSPRASTRRMRAGLRAALVAVDAGRLRVGAGARRRAHGRRGLAHAPASRPRRAAAHRPLAQRSGRVRPSALPQGPAARRCTPARSTWPRRCSTSPSRHRTVLWPGYTHQRRAMPSSVGLWAGAYAEGLLDTVESLAAALAGRWTARRWAAPPAMACRCRSSARPRRARSASPGSTTTWRRCRAAAASSRRRCSSGAPSWATSSRGSRRT